LDGLFHDENRRDCVGRRKRLWPQAKHWSRGRRNWQTGSASSLVATLPRSRCLGTLAEFSSSSSLLVNPRKQNKLAKENTKRGKEIEEFFLEKFVEVVNSI
jgi:hypothetical protein